MFSGLYLVLDSFEKLLDILAKAEIDFLDGDDASIERELHLCGVQMYLYLLCRISYMFEVETQNRYCFCCFIDNFFSIIADIDVWVFRQKSVSGLTVKKGARKEVASEDIKNFISFWTSEREKVVEVLLKMTAMSFESSDGRSRNCAIRFLWQPPIVCPNFLRFVRHENADFCFSSNEPLTFVNVYLISNDILRLSLFLFMFRQFFAG